MTQKTKETTAGVKLPEKLLNKPVYNIASSAANANPWREIKTYLTKAVDKDMYNNTVNLCRFFYRTDTLVSTVINKLVEIGVNDVIISKRGLSENEFRVFQSLKPRLLEFAETMAQELLISGLVVPEIGYGPIEKDEIFELGIKKYSRLIFPVSMWVRDPNSIKIKSNMAMTDTPSYFVVIPDEIVRFIKSGGKYPDGTEDIELFENLKTYYPEFVTAVNSGAKEYLIDNKLIIRRKYLTGNTPYPITYIEPSLDALQHKRRMRRMDYSIIDKVISAIMHIKVGSDEFPVTDTEEDNEVFNNLRAQLAFRFLNDENLERIFQLITNHTIDISWIFPDTALLTESGRYDNINEEILFGLGFPRVLITGETARTGTSNADIAILSPVKTIESIRRKLLKVIREICKTVAQENNFKVPSVSFSKLNLHSFQQFIAALQLLYNVSGVSRTDFAEYMGYDFEEQAEKLEAENTLIEAKGLSAFGEQPFSRDPGKSNPQQNQNPTGKNNPKVSKN